MHLGFTASIEYLFLFAVVRLHGSGVSVHTASFWLLYFVTVSFCPPEIPVLTQLSIPQLNRLVDEIDSCIRYYSACLVHELATREELDYEQELKDIFFTLLLEVHSRIEGFDSRSRPLSPETRAGAKEADGDPKKTFLSGNSVSAKTTLANAALAVRLRWRRMSRSIETARSSSLSAAGGRLMRRTSSALSYLRRLTQPIRSQDVTSAVQTITTSNSTIDLPCLYEYQDCEWAEMRSPFHRDGESLSASATPTCNLSPRRLPWYESSSSSLASSKKRRAKRGHSREKALKFLSTRIPFHLSATGDGPTVGHLELFNDFLRCMLTNNPNLTPLLTDYILNVYAPGDKSTPKLII
uniref:Fasciculation and elongation protein zeta-1 n=1 Tax=Schistocephalus solidus TaxID=70667 RepID=A0A0X3PD01_SCHSO